MVLQFGLSPEYVLDKIQTYELQALSKYSYLKTKGDWEQTRFHSCILANCHSKKKLETTDIVKFPWEKEEAKSPKQIKIDKERINQLKLMAQELIKNNMI